MVVTSPPSQVPSLDTITLLWGRARSAATRLRWAAQVTQKRSSCQTKRWSTPTGQPAEFVQTTAALGLGLVQTVALLGIDAEVGHVGVVVAIGHPSSSVKSTWSRFSPRSTKLGRYS